MNQLPSWSVFCCVPSSWWRENSWVWNLGLFINPCCLGFRLWSRQVLQSFRAELNLWEHCHQGNGNIKGITFNVDSLKESNRCPKPSDNLPDRCTHTKQGLGDTRHVQVEKTKQNINTSARLLVFCTTSSAFSLLYQLLSQNLPQVDCQASTNNFLTRVVTWAAVPQ